MLTKTIHIDIKDDEKSETILNELENIDDDLDKYGIQLVKSDYNNALPAYGVKKVWLLKVKVEWLALKSVLF